MKNLFLVLTLTAITALGADSSRLKSELLKTEAWLRANGSATEQGWKEFLRWDELQAELAKPTPDLATLRLIVNRWRKNNVGLEAPQFVATQAALKGFIRAVELDQVADRAAACRQWKAEALATYTDQAGALMKGRAAGWLAYACPEERAAVEAERARFAKANLRFQVSAEAITFGFPGMEVHNQKFVRTTIQGVATQGTTYTDGKVTARPVPGSGGRGEIEIALNATLHSPSNYGEKGPVGIHSRSTGSAHAVARLAIDEQGIHLASSGANASMSPQVTGISAPGPIIRWFANRQISRSRGATAAEASGKAATQVRDEFVSTLLKQLPDSSKAMTPVKNLLNFQGTHPERVKTFSTSEVLGVQLTERNAFQLAAPTEPPVLRGKFDLTLDVHESFVGNYMGPYMGGKQEWEWSLYNVHKLLTMEEPTELRPHDNAARWYFWADDYRPFTTDFQGGKIRMRFYGTSIGRVFRGVEEKIERPFVTTVDYEPVLNTKLGYLHRIGEVTLQYTDDKPATEVSDKLAAMLQRKMDAFFPEHFEFGGLSIPKGSSVEKLRQFKLRDFRAQAGWLTMGFALEK